MDSLGSKAMPEKLLITKAFDQQLRALAYKASISYATYSYTDRYTV